MANNVLFVVRILCAKGSRTLSMRTVILCSWFIYRILSAFIM